MGYRLSASGGVIDTGTNEHIPPVTGNRRWAEYLAFVAGGGTADPVETPDLTTYKARAIALLEVQAERERAKWVPQRPAEAAYMVLRYDEARRCAADDIGNRTAANYPLMDAEIPETAATVSLVATAVNTERATKMTGLADVEDVRRTAAAAINAAASNAAVDSALAAVAWPS